VGDQRHLPTDPLIGVSKWPPPVTAAGTGPQFRRRDTGLRCPVALWSVEWRVRPPVDGYGAARACGWISLARRLVAVRSQRDGAVAWLLLPRGREDADQTSEGSATRRAGADAARLFARAWRGVPCGHVACPVRAGPISACPLTLAARVEVEGLYGVPLNPPRHVIFFSPQM
jgi:hypothetical protein